jgi:hypothetical protein
MMGEAPAFSIQALECFFALYSKTILWISTIWLVAFPKILSVAQSEQSYRGGDPRTLFSSDVGTAVLTYADSL